ncbi:MAG: carboxymuconolactone decarboxylase family protein [Miltoncostaeaceae bacterium]
MGPGTAVTGLAIAPHVPELKRGLAALTRAGAGLDGRLSELVKTRVSQMNGCAHCVDLHAAALRADGEDPRRVDVLPAWRSSRLFDPRERAALALAEALTGLASSAPAAAVYEEAVTELGEEAAALVAATTIGINAWNRFMVASGAQED